MGALIAIYHDGLCPKPAEAASAGQKVPFTEVIDKAAAMSPKFEEKIRNALPAFCEGSDNFLHCKKTVRKAFVCTELAARAKDWLKTGDFLDHVTGVEEYMEKYKHFEDEAPF